MRGARGTIAGLLAGVGAIIASDGSRVFASSGTRKPAPLLVYRELRGGLRRKMARRSESERRRVKAIAAGKHVPFRGRAEKGETAAERIARLERRARTVTKVHGSGTKRPIRALICAEQGVPDTGRQWRKLRKRLRRQEVAHG